MYDTYHLAGYHQLAEEQNDVHAVLLVYEDEPVVIGIPLLLRRLDSVEGIEEAAGYFDATSVYGYPGPITNSPQVDRDIVIDFSEMLKNYLREARVISVFSRLNPLMDQDYLLQDFGQVVDIGPTAAIDLTLPVDVQEQHYRTDHRYRINKAKREGVVCQRDEEWNHFDDFIEIYNQTMRRVDAADYYFFSNDYFYRLRDLLEDHLQLFLAFKGETVISASLFTVCNSIIQYHLSGTRSEYLDLSPNRIILDAARIWGTEVGAKVLHLGGGVGGKEDGLFHFKSGFSNLTYQFKIWRAVVNKEAYRDLNTKKQFWNDQHHLEVVDQDYFPEYRAPTRKKD